MDAQKKEARRILSASYTKQVKEASVSYAAARASASTTAEEARASHAAV